MTQTSCRTPDKRAEVVEKVPLGRRIQEIERALQAVIKRICGQLNARCSAQLQEKMSIHAIQ